MDLEQICNLAIPQKQEERNKVLKDALKTKNPFLIEFALCLDVDPRVGREELLEYAIQSGNLELAQTLIPSIEKGKEVAMEMALKSDQIEIIKWLSREGVVLHIGQKCVKEHLKTVTCILRENPEAKTSIYYGALLETIFLKDAAKVLNMLLDSFKKNNPEELEKVLEKLADDTVDTDRVQCMKVMIQFGLDARNVNTKYCQNAKMRKFMKENGARID